MPQNRRAKLVDLDLSGSETELDNNIIQQISDPLVHLVRNSVAHGIERPEDRIRAGKPELGKVSLRAYHRGNHIYIEVEDDGRGIDYERVKLSAIERGLVSPETADRLTERDLREMLFHPGFTTAPVKTELAGRGVGLDVVRANLNALNGEIDIQSVSGQGTKFTLKVPLTLIISPALFVRCGVTNFALPLAVVEEIRRLRADEIEDVGGKLLTKVRDVVTEVVRLDTYLGLPPLEPMNGYFRMVVANAGNRQIGLVVEEVLGKDEIVIKNLGEYLRRVKLFPGTTIAPDGSLILLIDLNRMVANEPTDTPSAPSQRQRRTYFCPGFRSRCTRHDSRRSNRPRRARASHRCRGRLHQRAQVRRAHARKEWLPREARRRRHGSRGTCYAARLPPGDHRPRNAAHDRLRTNGATAAEPDHAPHPGDGRYVASGRKASRSRDERRRDGLPDQQYVTNQ